MLHLSTKPHLIVQFSGHTLPLASVTLRKIACFLDTHRNQFKAHPINTKILTNPNTGVRKVPSKPLTQPEEFALSSGIQKKKEEEEEEEKEHFEFHANPLNKKILEGPVVCHGWIWGRGVRGASTDLVFVMALCVLH